MGHGHSWKGGYSPTYGSWSSMKQRCRPDGKYGRRGITVCERWVKFENFLADMGERPAGKTLDRIDALKGYEPSNCRWASHEEQVANRQLPQGRTCPAGCTCGRHNHPKCEAGCTCYKHTPPVRTAEWNAKIAASNRAYRARVREALAR